MKLQSINIENIGCIRSLAFEVKSQLASAILHTKFEKLLFGC